MRSQISNQAGSTSKGMVVKSGIKSGGTFLNHNQTARTVLIGKRRIKSGGLSLNQNQAIRRGIAVKSAVKSGGLSINHNQTACHR
jgi:hypothetical protein